METVYIIIEAILVIGYVACAVMFIHQCETKLGTICLTALAIGIGFLIAFFIEYLIAIAICAIILEIIKLS